MGIDNPVHLIFIAAVALIVLGPKRLPDLARSLGHGMREFRESMSEAVKDDGSVTGTLVPENPQLVPAPESATPAPADAVVVDPAAPPAPQPVATAVQQSVPAQPPTPAETAVPATQTAVSAAEVSAPEAVAPPAAPPVA
jgi:sec-independent protein translocase protein TatA